MKHKSLLITTAILLNSLSFLAQEKGTLTDSRDGKVYKIVKISNQTWMAENLAYKANSSCLAYNNDKNNVLKYGYLYIWKTANKVCPSGWHLPNKTEFEVLVNYLGGRKVAGGKMKATKGWKYSADVITTGNIGFNALPAGYRFGGGLFGYLGEGTFFWSSMHYGSGEAVAQVLTYYSNKFGHGHYNQTDACSVRCIQD